LWTLELIIIPQYTDIKNRLLINKEFKMKKEKKTRPQWDNDLGKSYIGKYIIIGITNLDHQGKEIERQQIHGIIESADEINGILINLKGSNEGKTWIMPPDQRAIMPASPGTYTLKTSGEKVENPDLLSTWTNQKPKPAGKKSKLGAA
jgi:hypothetical protein